MDSGAAMIRRNPVHFYSAVFVLVSNLSSYAQLPKRPMPGETEEPVAAEVALKVDEYFETYIANYKTINRFIGVTTLDRTIKREGEPREIELMNFVHAQDFKGHVRRLDALQPVIVTTRDGTQKPSVFKLTTIESEKGAWQRQTARTSTSADRDSFEKDEDFERKFRVQIRLDFWDMPLAGSMPVLFQNGYPKLTMRELPRFPALFQEGGQITAWHDDLEKASARVTLASGFAYDITFSKDMGNMPIRVVVSRNDKSWQGIQSIIDTQWVIYRSNDYAKPVYLPAQINCEYTLQNGKMRDTHEFEFNWLIGKEVDDSVFSQESDLFMEAIEVQEMVQSKRIEIDRRKAKSLR